MKNVMQDWVFDRHLELRGKSMQVWTRPSHLFDGEFEFTMTHQPTNPKIDFVKPAINTGCWTSEFAFNKYLSQVS